MQKTLKDDVNIAHVLLLGLILTHGINYSCSVKQAQQYEASDLNHVSTASLHHTTRESPSLQLDSFARGGFLDYVPRRMSSVFALSTNSPGRSWTRSDPASAQSSPGSIPSVTGLAPHASDWPGRPWAVAARGSPVAFAHRPIWGTRLLWPRRRRWTAHLVGCSTGSPGRPGSKDHYNVPETAP